jgi:hypothetical protein
MFFLRNLSRFTIHVPRIAEDFFEHPAAVFSSCPRRVAHRSFVVPKWFFRSRQAAPSIR